MGKKKKRPCEQQEASPSGKAPKQLCIKDLLSIQNNDSSALCPVLTPERIAVLSSEGAAAESRSDLQRDKREKANLQTKQHLAAATVACHLKH